MSEQQTSDVQLPDYDEIMQRVYHSEAFQSARMQLYFTCMQFMTNNSDCLTKWLSTFPKPAEEQAS